MADPENEQRPFTSWKLALWDAISMDAELNPTERLIAWRLLQHINRDTRAIFPTQRRLAIQMAVSEQTVKQSIAVLIERGWLTKKRRNRRQSNRYEFVETLIEPVKSEVDDCVNSDTLRVRKRTVKKSLRVRKLPLVTGKKLPLVRVRKLPPNTERELPEEEHLNECRNEEKNTPELVDGQGAVSPSKAKAVPALDAALAKIDPSRRSNATKAGDGSQPVPLASHSPAKRPLASFNGKPVIPPDFDTLEIEQQEREAKRRRRLAAGQ